MNKLLSNIKIAVHPFTYIKDPESSALGKKIITGSITLINKIGFEEFNFKKLAQDIESTEASVYRYFESKHKLLLYLITWYWSWLEYKLVFSTANVTPPKAKLKKAIEVLTEKITEDNNFTHINEVKLQSIVFEDASKAYLTREVDKENKEGVFLGYKQLVQRVCDIISEMNPNYKYPHMLISTVIEGAHLQRYYADHLPRLTDSIKGEDSVVQFYTQLVLKNVEN